MNRRGAARLGPHALWGSPVWALKVFAPHTMAYLAGVPKTYAMTGDDARFVAEFIDSMFPIAAKVQGVIFEPSSPTR